MTSLKKIYNGIIDFFKIIYKILDAIGVDFAFIKFAVLFFGFRFFFFDITLVPSGSMTPTAKTGDFILVNKFAHGVSSQNIHIPWLFFPGSCMLSKSKTNMFYILHKIFPNVDLFNIEVKRGDLVSFVLTRDPKTIYFKRIVAIGGDTVQMKNGCLHINGNAVQMEKIKETEFVSDQYSYRMEKAELYQITLDNGVTYQILRDCPIGTHLHDNTIEYIVPKDHVWVQGDFNTNSADSFEYNYTGGAIPVVNLIGKPILSIVGTRARDKKEPTGLEWLISLPLRIIRYIYYIDISRIGVKLK